MNAAYGARAFVRPALHETKLVWTLHVAMDVARVWTLSEWREEVEGMLRDAGARLVDWRVGRPIDVNRKDGGWWKVVITARRQLTARDARQHLPTISDDSEAFEPNLCVRAHDNARQASRKRSHEAATQTDESGPIPVPSFMFRLECDEAREEALREQQEVRRRGHPTREDSAVLFAQGMLNWVASRGGMGVRVYRPFKTAVVGEVQVRVQVRVKRSSGEAWREEAGGKNPLEFWHELNDARTSSIIARGYCPRKAECAVCAANNAETTGPFSEEQRAERVVKPEFSGADSGPRDTGTRDAGRSGGSS